MINGKNPYKLDSGDIVTSKKKLLSGESINTYTYNVTYYDDTKVKQRLSYLESEVSDIQSQDEGFRRRLSLLESHESNWATKTELHQVEGRVTTLETIPVGITNAQMDEILDD